MNRIDRTIAPKIIEINHVSLPEVEKTVLDNGIKVYAIPSQEDDITKLQLVFNAGKWHQEKKLVAGLAARMLREGTKTKSGKALAGFFDFYGSNFSTDAEVESTTIDFYCLSRYLKQQLPLIFEIITESIFPESELKTISANRKKNLAIALEQNEELSNRHFMRAIWGAQHPLGAQSEISDFDLVNIEDLKAFSNNFYNASNCFIILAGKYDTSTISEINKIFGQKNWMGKPAPKLEHPIMGNKEKRIHIERENSVQSSIHIGNISLNRAHPDFITFSLANTILGGYFGSHLMTNIRQEKGYTYGIYSSLISYPHAAYIDISSEVGKEFCNATFNEIEREIKWMQTNLVEDEELKTVKNYVGGKILRSVDGAFRFSAVLKTYLLRNIELSYIPHFLQSVRQLTAEDILRVSEQHLNFNEMYKVDVG